MSEVELKYLNDALKLMRKKNTNMLEKCFMTILSTF